MEGTERRKKLLEFSVMKKLNEYDDNKKKLKMVMNISMNRKFVLMVVGWTWTKREMMCKR